MLLVLLVSCWVEETKREAAGGHAPGSDGDKKTNPVRRLDVSRLRKWLVQGAGWNNRGRSRDVPETLFDELASLDLKARQEVATILRQVSETFEEVPMVVGTPPTHFGCWPTGSTPADGR